MQILKHIKMCFFVGLAVTILGAGTINANEVNPVYDNNISYRAIEQNTSDGTKLVNVSSNGEVFNLNEVYGMSGSKRLDEINTRYSRNSASIKENGRNARLESNKVNKDNVAEECKKFLQKESQKLGIDPNNLRCYNVLASDKIFVVVFVQTINGYDIMNSFVRMYVYPDGKIQTFTSMYYDDVYETLDVLSIPNIHQLEAYRIQSFGEFETLDVPITSNNPMDVYSVKNFGEAAILGLRDESPNVSYEITFAPSIYILPIFNGSGYTYKPVVEANIKGDMELYKTYIDATNYELLLRKNLVWNVNINVESKHYDINPNLPMIVGPMRNLQIDIEGEGVKVTTGSGVINNLPESVIGKKFTTKLDGNYVVMQKRVYPAETGGVDYIYQGTITNDGIKMHDSNDYDEVMRTIYNNVTAVRNYYILMDPSPSIGNKVTAYAQIIENPSLMEAMNISFNAYASGDATLVFLAANHKNVFMGKLDKVCYHEYGHSMVYAKYREMGKNTGMFSSMANEANADITSAFIKDNPRVFDGIVKTGLEGWAITNNLHRTCENDYVFPTDILGESHYDSQILSGAFWDFKTLAPDFDIVKRSVHFAKEYLPDGYTAEEVFANWFDAMVRANDRYKDEYIEDPNTGDIIENPYHFEHNFNEVYQAFNKHKIGFNNLVNNKFRHSNAPDQPDASNPIPISCEILDFATPKNIEQVYVNYYTNFSSGTKSVLLTRQDSPNGSVYTGQIPAQEAGSRVFYSFSYRDPFSNNNDVINRNYFLFVGYDSLHSNNCDAANGWSIQNQNTNTYGWSIKAPPTIYTYNQRPWNHILYSPGYTAIGNRCFSTNVTVVTSGKDPEVQTIRDSSYIESPTFNFNNENVFLTYQKWHICAVGDHLSSSGLFVEVSFDGGNTWRLAQEFRGRQKPNNWEWQREYINLTKFKEEGEDFSNLKVRFVCYANNNSIGLNALIDDIALLGTDHPNSIENTPYINELYVNPNPAGNEATLTFPFAVINPEITISNTLGNEMLNVKLQGEYNFANINTADLLDGVYFLKVFADGKIYQTKLLIVR
ncbi:MAG: T9SS type A sorting domain-containing protein [Bacteroidetes bacterium]|nr:T9SS type A sorting domain-containing protein [Bacteroidota bacterium]